MSLPIFNDSLDDTPTKEEEGGFSQLNNTDNAAELAVGTLTRAENVWMQTDGLVHTRPGRKIVSQQINTTGTPVAALGYFDTPTHEALIFPAGTGVWEILSDSGPQTPVAIAAGILPATGKKSMAPLIDRMFINNTTDLRWVHWNGASWSNGSVTQFSNGSAMPVFDGIAAHRFRIFGWVGNRIYASKILSAHVSGAGGDWSSLDNIIVGTGGGDPTKAVLSGQQESMFVINEGSVWTVDTSNASVAAWTISKLTDVVGCVAGATAIMVGRDVYFLSKFGLVSLAGLVTKDTISQADTISAPVHKTIERINWAAVDNEVGARCTLWGNLLLLALPVDGSTVANVVLAYNTLTKRWVGEWTATAGGSLWGHAAITRFGGIQQTIWCGGGGGSIYRLDPDYLKDDIGDSATADLVSWVKTRAMWFTMHEAIKQPFWLEAEFHRSGSTDLTVVFVPDDEITYPEEALADVRVIQTGFSGSNFLTFPLVLPFTFVSRYTRRISWHIRDQPRFREGQLIVHSSRGEMGLRKLRMASFLDTPKL